MNGPCPTCHAQLVTYGSRLVCESCHGALVTNAELEQLLNEMSPDDERPLARRLFPGKGPTRACPRCATNMATNELFGVTIDRCDEHGIWFDPSELQRILQANGDLYANRRVSTTGPMFLTLGGMFGEAMRALFGPLIERHRLARDVARTTPPAAKDERA
jgi:Zn-finger nucleic acid-binding protein